MSPVCYQYYHTYHQTNAKNLKDDWLRALPAFPEDISLVLGAHVGWLTTSHNSNSRTSDNFFWPLGHPHTHAHIRKT